MVPFHVRGIDQWWIIMTVIHAISLSKSSLVSFPVQLPSTMRSLCRLTDTYFSSRWSLAYFLYLAVLHLAQHTPQSTIQHHRLVYATLAEQLASGLHALQIKAKTPAEFEAVGAAAAAS